MNVFEIIDESFKVLRTFSPDHKNVIDVHPSNYNRNDTDQENMTMFTHKTLHAYVVVPTNLVTRSHSVTKNVFDFGRPGYEIRSLQDGCNDFEQ